MICPDCEHRNPADTLFCGKCGLSLKKSRKKAAGATKTLRIPVRELAIGMDFAGRYQVIEDLGKGGMGRVYKVLDKEIKEVVALKILKPGIMEDDEIIERFHNELKLARRISHKNVCGLYHLSKDENETYYITMEYVSGEDLKNLIRRVGQLTIGKAVFITKQICDGLAEAHRLGVVHRDLKPQNIMIDRDGHVRIMDFGIARSLSSKGPTGAHAIIGTPDYMSPEQIDGKEVDHRTDIYSLGVILYEMLTGHLPFEGQSPLAVALKQKSQSPASPKKFNPHIPDSLCHVVLKCLEKKREKRFQDLTSLSEELTRIEKALHLAANTNTKDSKTQKITRAIKRGLRWQYAAFLALALGGGFLLYDRVLARIPRGYDNYISMEVVAAGPSRDLQKPVEFVLNRALSASTKRYVFVQRDLLTYKKRTQSDHSVFRPAILSITGEITPKVVGYEINLTTRFRNRTSRKTFDCKGHLDFMAKRADDILAYLKDYTGGLVGPIEGGNGVAGICTSNIDALEHFLKGEAAWDSLDSEQAFYEFRTALENDPSFGLSHLRLADVLTFRSDFEAARSHLDLALAEKDRLIELDLLRLYALRARLNSKPSEERQFLGKLTEEFPFKKEYHYEFAESYFRCGAAEEAITHYLKALELDGNYPLAHNHLAYCYAWTGEHDKAQEHFRRYQELAPTANSYDSLATGYMFAGEYERALAVIGEGLKINPGLDYLYGNMARNQILLGQLAKAREAINRQASVTTREFTKINTGFWLAFIEYLKGNRDEARRLLAPTLHTYRQAAYQDRLDEAPNLPSWLTGIMAAQNGDVVGLRKEAGWMEEKIARHAVSATNYFPILKFSIHLKMLTGLLEKNPGLVMSCIEEGRQMRTKMGYRSSLFNLAYFYNHYVQALLALTDSGDARALAEARALLTEANKYNPRYAWTHLNLARLFLKDGDEQGARSECLQAKSLLSGADPDYIMTKTLLEIQIRPAK
jgi:serine/threonine protein kinase/Tfp pilus assembly protein PilF